MARNDWTTREDAMLRRCAAEGLSYGQTAEKLPLRSRNAVAGRAQRLGVRFKGEQPEALRGGAATTKK